MAETEALPPLLDLSDELVVASTLLAMMEGPEAAKPILAEMCLASVLRCQELTAKLVRIDRHKG